MTFHLLIYMVQIGIAHNFFQSIFDIISNFELFVTAGDLNHVLDQNIDYFNYNHIDNQKSRDTVLKMTEVHSLIKPWMTKY